MFQIIFNTICINFRCFYEEMLHWEIGFVSELSFVVGEHCKMKNSLKISALVSNLVSNIPFFKEGVFCLFTVWVLRTVVIQSKCTARLFVSAVLLRLLPVNNLLDSRTLISTFSLACFIKKCFPFTEP